MKSLISDSLCLQALSLPRFIKQEDGSRDQCVRVFNDMDEDNSGVIDRRKFLMYLDRREKFHDLEIVESADKPSNEAAETSSNSSVSDDESENPVNLLTKANQVETESDSESDKGDVKSQENANESESESESESEDDGQDNSVGGTVSDQGAESEQEKSDHGDEQETEMQSHPQSNLFSMIDRNSDGKLTLIEFIQALRTQPAVSKVQTNEISHL
jgi:Ca2+-binding EF-hand superfamily protein